MKKTYLFYDIETTGLNKAFDQILQFAAIRTDRQLNEIERYTIRVKLRPDVIPSPGAIITNRLSLSDFALGLCEFEAIRQIHELLNQRQTISLGYNSLGFDDEFLRFSMVHASRFNSFVTDESASVRRRSALSRLPSMMNTSRTGCARPFRTRST